MRCPECPAPSALPSAQPGIAAYLKCATQWRYSFGGRAGLDYPACIQIIKLARQRWRAHAPADPFVAMPLAELIDDVQIIEAALLQADNERREKEEAQRDK